MYAALQSGFEQKKLLIMRLCKFAAENRSTKLCKSDSPMIIMSRFMKVNALEKHVPILRFGERVDKRGLRCDEKNMSNHRSINIIDIIPKINCIRC